MGAEKGWFAVCHFKKQYWESSIFPDTNTQRLEARGIVHNFLLVVAIDTHTQQLEARASGTVHTLIAGCSHIDTHSSLKLKLVVQFIHILLVVAI